MWLASQYWWNSQSGGESGLVGSVFHNRDSAVLRVVSLQPLDDSMRIDGMGGPLVEVCDAGPAIDRIGALKPNVLILHGDRPDIPVVEAFSASAPRGWSRLVTPRPGNGSAADPVPPREGHEAMLRDVERDFARSVNFAPARALIRGQAPAAGGSSVLVVGGGAVGLMTALALSDRGFAVTVLEAAPPPGDADWRTYGCTHGGEDARMFSITEYDNYNEKRDRLYADMAEVFERPLSEGGWLAIDPAARDAEERAWNEMFKRVPAWLARGYSEEIYGVGREARQGWRAVFARYPQLREGTGFCEGLVRTYDDPVKFEAARALQASLGSLERVLAPAELAARHPIFAGACAAGAICGALEIMGFTVQVHAFARRMVALLRERGVAVHWRSRAERCERDGDGVIRGLVVHGEVWRADHYVISPGVYGGALLDGFASGGLLHGVAGAWLVLPHRGGAMPRSAKLKRTAALNEDVNVTVGRRPDGAPVLILGSGYGYVGRDGGRIDAAQLALMYAQLDAIAARFFPDAFAAACASGMTAQKRYCVRPWTPTGLGVFEAQPAAGGLALVIGGHNTGGFAVAPAVADAVASALAGDVVDMHWQFEPNRLAAAVPALHRFAL